MLTKLKYWILGVLTVLAFGAGIAYAASYNLPPAIQRGDLVVATSTTQLVRLPTSTKGSVLWVSPITGVPAWTATSTLGISGGSGTVTNVTGSGNIASSGGTTPNITFTGVLPLANGGTGSTTLNTALVPEGTNLYFTNTRAQNAISLTTTGTSGAATYSAGILNIPNYATGGSGITAWTIGNGIIYNATSTDSVDVGTSTPTTANLFVQGTGTKAVLNAASSSGVSYLQIGGTNSDFLVTQNLGANQRNDISLGGNTGASTDYNPLPGSYLQFFPEIRIGQDTGGKLIASTTAACAGPGCPAYGNVFVGAGIAINATSSNESVAIGDNACQAILGFGNDCFGLESGRLITDGQSNLTGGNDSFIFGNGNENVIWGAGSGFFIAGSGNNYNTFLGNGSGYSLASSTNNIIIGHKDQLDSTSTSNVLDIGELLWGKNLTTQTNLVYTGVGAGQIGIGTSTPIAKFTVVASSTDSTIPIFVAASSTGTSYLTVAASGKTSLNSLLLQNVASGTQCLQADSSGNVTGTGSGCGGSSGTVSGGIGGYVTTWASSTGLTTGILLDNGTVAGANATSSTVSFTVKGTSNLNPFNVTSSTGASILQVLANKNVQINGSPLLGLGTGGGLSVKGAGSLAEFETSSLPGYISIYNSGLNVDGLIGVTSAGIFSGDLANSFVLGNNSAGPLQLASNSIDRMTISSNGLVGIGVTNPVAQLQVNGASTTAVTLSVVPVAGQSANILQVASSSGTSYLTIAANGTLTETATSTLATTTINGINIVGQFDKSFQLASTTLDTFNLSFSSATTTFQLWNPSYPVKLTKLYCKTDTGTVLLNLSGNLVNCTSSGASSTPSTLFGVEADINASLGSAASSPNRVRVTTSWVAQ